MLKENDWSVEAAVNVFYQQTSGTGSADKGVDEAALNALFDRYKGCCLLSVMNLWINGLDCALDETDDEILLEGTEKICEDLQLDPTDVAMLVFAFHMKCENMCEFKRSGWLEGWKELECDTIDALRTKIPSLRAELEDTASAKQIYQFTFNFAKPDTQKSLPLETAVAFWSLLLKDRFKHLDLWITFLQENHGKTISKDTWNLVTFRLFLH